METGLFQLVSDLATAGVLTDTTLLLIVIGLIFYGYKNILRPMLDRVNGQPTLDEIKSIAQTRNEEEDLNVEELSLKLDKLLEKLNEVEGYSKSNERDISELKRDIEQIKQILNHTS
jgi:peptidoglycan hydrolase CwlO-like protein